MTPPRLGVNLLFLVPGVVGGSEEYSVRVLQAVAEHGRDRLELVLFARRELVERYPELCRAVETVTVTLPRNRVLRVGAESTWLAGNARRHGVALMHHMGGRVPALGRAGVVTIHDLQPLDAPERFHPVKRRYLAYALPRSARRARRIVTVSEFTRRGVAERFGIDLDHIDAISAPCPAPRDLDGPWRAAAVAALAPELRALAEGDRPYFVYPAITHRHKNHLLLIDAFARVAAPDARLVLAGGPGSSEPEVQARLARPDVAGRVIRTARLDRAPLDALLAHATALAFPSQYEGFGLPVVEAMALGCPVIAADATALPEAVGDAGVLVAVDAADAWTDALQRALAWDQPTRRHLVEVGYARVIALSPAAVAARWIACHEAALA